MYPNNVVNNDTGTVMISIESTNNMICVESYDKAGNSATATRIVYVERTVYEFSYTGSVQTIVVPPNVTKALVELWGAQGGSNVGISGGIGGYSRALINVTPGQTIYVYVGEQPTGTTGGFNGGGGGSGYITPTATYTEMKTGVREGHGHALIFWIP